MSFVPTRNRHAIFITALMTLLLSAFALVHTSTAAAQADSFHLGNGTGGAFTAGGGSTTLNHAAPITAAASAGSSSVTIGAERGGGYAGVAGLTANRLVLVIQSTGFTGTATDGSATAINLTSDNVGAWELARVDSVAAGTVTFTSPLIRSYAATGAQLVTIPEFTTATIGGGNTVRGPAWDGASGGFVGFLATGAVTVSGSLSAAGSGFRGGTVRNTTATGCAQLVQGNNNRKGEGIVPSHFDAAGGDASNGVGAGNKANGAGGGNCAEGGGGGGGSRGTGGKGGNTSDSNRPFGGYGGAPLTYSPYNHFVFGGGGGSGDDNGGDNGAGGASGGVVFVRGASLGGAGSITAAGANGANSSNRQASAGGGGGGGVVYARFAGALNCTTMSVAGGNGGSTPSYWLGGDGSPGGGGAGGYVLLQGSSVGCTPNTNSGIAGENPSGNADGATPTTNNGAGNIGLTTTQTSALIKPVGSVTTPTNGSYTTDSTPTISGTGTAGAAQAIYINGVLTTSVTADGAGAWSYTPASPLGDGPYSVYVVPSLDSMSGDASTAVSFTIDTTAPTAPSVTSPVSPFTTNDATPTLIGLAEPDNWVYIYVDGVLKGITFSNGSGDWEMELGVTAEGAHTIYVTSVDAAGNTSPQSAPDRALTIDLTAPAVSITSPASDGLIVGPNGNIAFTATDAVGPVTTTCQIDATPAVSCTSPFAYSGLATGGHTFTVTATDAANNSTVAVRTFTVDATPPNTSITSNPAAVTNATGASFSFTSTESPATFECSLDGAPASTCTSPQAYSSLSEGSHTFAVRAIDQYGNVDLTPASYAWTVDLTEPIAPTISTPGSDIITSDTTPAIGGLSEPGSTVNVYEGATLIGSAVADVSGVWALSPDPTLTSGSHPLVARATDPAGNVSADSGTRTIVVDSAAPTVTISAPADGSAINTATPAITFSVTDANESANSTCTIDGTPVTCTTGYTPAALGEGPHTVFVSHTDLAGNVGTSATHTFTVDTIAPEAPVITGGPSAPVASTSAAFTFTGEPGATYECFIDSPVAWTSCASGVSYSSLDQGAHTFYVRQIDAAGNVGPEASRSWSVDTVGPPAPSVSGPTGTVGSTSASIDFNDLESPVTYMCSLDAAPAALCASPVNLTGLADGLHTYEVYAVDTLGNAGSPTSISWTVDSSLFTAGITAGPIGTVATNDNSLTFTATIVSGTTFMCRVDADVFASCTSPFSTGVLSDGSHTFEVYAVNDSQTSATVSRTWTIDTAGPVLTIDAPTDLQTVGPNGNVMFSATDGSGPITYTCQIDGDAPVSCGSPFVFTGLTDGAHSVTIVASDGVGNSSIQVRDFNVDASPPETTITDSPPNSTNSTSPSFSFNSSEGSSTFECSLDGGPIASCTSATNYAGLSEGSHTFSVRAIDQYGNVDPTPASFTWSVDLTAPVAPSINTPAADIVTTDTTPAIAGLSEANSTVNIYEGATLIGTAIADGSGIWSLSPDPTFAEGPHALVARATDEAGNTSVDSVTRTITVDLTSPVVDITAPTFGSVTNDNTPDIVFTATDDNLASVQCSVDGGTPVACTSPWTTDPLDDGTHVVQVIATDGTGTQQTVDSVTFSVDTVAPDDPAINTPATDISTQNVRPTIGGTAEPGAVITVYDGASSIGTTTANGGGTWSFTPISDLSEAAHPLRVTATDEAGNTSGDSNIRTITIDVTAPGAPAISSPATDIATNNVRPPLGGTAEPNAEITVFDGATSIGTTTADGSGDWTFTPSSDLSEAVHDFHVTATDEAGNTSANSNVRTITVDVSAPDAPEITSPATNLTTTVNTQPIGGTAEPNSTVTIYDGATEIGTAVADGSGNWTLSPDPTFAEGSHAITAWSTDAAGNTSDASSIRTITIDNTAPVAPSINGPADGADLGDPTPTISGIGESDTTIEVFDGPTLICTTTVDSLGNWSCTPSTPLGEGDHTFTATSEDPAGNVSDPSEEVDVNIDTTVPSVSITSPVPASTVATSTPGISFAATDSNLDSVECRVDTDQTWVPCASAWTTPSLPDGVRTVEVRATDNAGNVEIASTVFIVDTTAPVTTIVSTPGSLDNDTTPSFTFNVTGGPATAECRILPAAFAPCTSPYTSAELGDGDHTFEVRSTDANGNVESPTQSYTWEIDTTPPPKPVVTAPVGGSTTIDNTPTISGTADPNSSVLIFVDGHQIGPVTADGGGQWTITSTTLIDGSHNVTAEATDDAGNTSTPSDNVDFTVDTTPPDGTIAPRAGTGGGTEPPTFDIVTPDGTATITCSVDGGAANPCSSPFKPSGTFAPGTHTILVTFTDPVGNFTTRTITFVIASPSSSTSAPATVTPQAPPPAADSDPLPAACFKKGIAISNVAVVGSKVKVNGFARLSYVGKTVTLTYKPTGAKVVARGTVGIDGSFSASAKAPAKKLRSSNKTLYRASVADESTPWTKLSRRVASSTATYKNGKLVVSGLLSKPLMPKAKVTIGARTGCNGPWKTITKGKVKSSGAFKTSTKYTVSTGVVFVRVAAVVSKGGKKPKPLRTYSFVMPVVLR